MSTDLVPSSMQRRVRERAELRCEYCGIAQEHQEATFHVHHVTPRIAGGATAVDNLALACVSCSLRKGPRREALDPASGTAAAIFNPRTESWGLHFHEGVDGVLVGLTATGRATIELLKMNRPLAIALRREVVARRGGSG